MFYVQHFILHNNYWVNQCWATDDFSTGTVWSPEWRHNRRPHLGQFMLVLQSPVHLLDPWNLFLYFYYHKWSVTLYVSQWRPLCLFQINPVVSSGLNPTDFLLRHFQKHLFKAVVRSEPGVNHFSNMWWVWCLKWFFLLEQSVTPVPKQVEQVWTWMQTFFSLSI